MASQRLPIGLCLFIFAATLQAADDNFSPRSARQTSATILPRPLNSRQNSLFESSESTTIDPVPLSLATVSNLSRYAQSTNQSDTERCITTDSLFSPIQRVNSQPSEANFDGNGEASERTSSIVTVPNTPVWNPLDTLSLFGGLEGSKQPQDFGVNANFGSRWAANWGFPLLAEYGIGMQVGTSVNHTDNAVQVFDRVGASTQRTQNYSTIAIFQRTDRWRWGAGYDFLYESYYDNFFLGQWRGRVGYAVSDSDEFGIWSTISQHHASGMFLTIPVTLTPLTQGSIYWQHQFMTGARIMSWVGVSEGHAQANLALGDLKKTGDQFVFGAEIDVPLNPYLALYGQANFISPADTGTVDSYLGFAYYPGGHAFPAVRNPFTPLLALANSTMFATDIKRD